MREAYTGLACGAAFNSCLLSVLHAVFYLLVSLTSHSFENITQGRKVSSVALCSLSTPSSLLAMKNGRRSEGNNHFGVLPLEIRLALTLTYPITITVPTRAASMSASVGMENAGLWKFAPENPSSVYHFEVGKPFCFGVRRQGFASGMLMELAIALERVLVRQFSGIGRVKSVFWVVCLDLRFLRFRQPAHYSVRSMIHRAGLAVAVLFATLWSKNILSNNLSKD